MNSALLVIDVQESFRARASWANSSTPDVADRVNQLAEATRAKGGQVIWVLHIEPGTGTVFDPESGHVRLMDELIVKDGEPLLRKTAHNAFTTTNLQQLLVSHGVTEVTVCGIRTEQCCETTARVASDLGYRVNFVTEATATEPIERNGVTLSTSDIIARTEFVLDGRFATIQTLAEAIA